MKKSPWLMSLLIVGLCACAPQRIEPVVYGQTMYPYVPTCSTSIKEMGTWTTRYNTDEAIIAEHQTGKIYRICCSTKEGHFVNVKVDGRYVESLWAGGCIDVYGQHISVIQTADGVVMTGTYALLGN